MTGDEAKDYARRAAKEEGLLVGISSGASLAATAKALADLPDGPGEVSFEPTDNVVLDTIKAMALADTGRFALRRGIEDLARTGDSRSTRGTRGELEEGERRVQVLRVRQGASWRPAPVLACALLVFRLHVATTFRSI